MSSIKSNFLTDKQQWITWIANTLRETAWAPLSVFGLYWVGLTLNLYKLFPTLDIPTHFMGGVVITYFYRSAIRHSQKLVGEIPLPIQVLFAITCTGTTTILWEFYENFADHYLNTNMVRGLQDTIMDLFVGLLGALVLSLFYRRRSSPS
jgi:hypothetical protein